MTNLLNGLTILRFAKAFKSGGGIERYLEDLDKMLLKRNKLKIIQMHLVKESAHEKNKIINIDQGCLVEIPMFAGVRATQTPLDKWKIKRSMITSFIKTIIRELVIYNPLLYRAVFKTILKRYSPQRGPFSVRNAGAMLKSLHQEHKIDLLVMHDIGSDDSLEVIVEAKKHMIPYIFINHYSNDCFNNISIREQLHGAAGIAGVNQLRIPKRLKDIYYNLSDGIDMEIFNPARVQSPEIKTKNPIIIYPARILPLKGQSDLIKAVANLRRDNINATIVFAGRTDSPEYEEELKRLVQRNGLTNDVLFVGQLNTEKLRDWYGISTVLGFPTYHREGLGRITIEAQAMKVPPVAYIIGGTPEGIQDGKTGYLVRKGDINTFTNRLRELLTNEEKRKHMGEEGRKFVQENFSLEALANRHEKYYAKVLDDYQRRKAQEKMIQR